MENYFPRSLAPPKEAFFMTLAPISKSLPSIIADKERPNEGIFISYMK